MSYQDLFGYLFLGAIIGISFFGPCLALGLSCGFGIVVFLSFFNIYLGYGGLWFLATIFTLFIDFGAIAWILNSEKALAELKGSKVPV